MNARATGRRRAPLPETPAAQSMPDVDPRISRTLEVRDHAGELRRWHLLDSGPWLAERGITPQGTLLAVHGNPTYSFLFRSLVREDIPWRLVAVDQLEMGWSERTGVKRRYQDRITDLSLLTDALSLRGPVVTVGHDWGGLISAGWALDNRHDLAGMILTNTGLHQDLGESLPRALQLATTPGFRTASTSVTDAFVRTTLSLSRPALAQEVQDAYLAPYRTRGRRKGIDQFVADIPAGADHPSRPTLERVAEGIRDLTVPTLLAWGPRDITFSDRFLRDLLERVPHADVHRFEKTSHLVWEDADVAGLVAEWLRSRFGPEAAQDEPAGTWRPVSSFAQQAPEQHVGEPIARLAADPTHAHRPAVVEMADADGRRREISWSLLNRRVDDIAAGMLGHGIRPGDRVSILITPGADLTAVLYACLRLGAVAVIADAGLGVPGLTRAVIGSHPDWLIGIPRALVGARAMGWPGRRISVEQLPTVDRAALGVETSIAQLARSGSMMRDLGAPLDAAWPAPDADAAILFTSGSTGPAKGAVYTHRQMSAMFTAVGDTLQLDPERGLVAGFAPFALLGPALGAPSVVPDMDITRPGELTAPALAAAIDALGEPAVFTAPAALRNILETAPQLDEYGRAAIASAASFFSAGAPIPAHLLRELRSLMPHARALTPYGMTECLAVAAIDLEGIEAAGEGSGVCVGRPVPRVELAVAVMDGEGRTPGEISQQADVTGEVLVRAPHVRDRYLMLWGTTHRSMRFTGWHATGDVGHLDAEGRLWIEGRADHVLATADGLFTPVQVEDAAETVPTVRRAGAAAVGPRGTQQVVVVLETEDGYRAGKAGRPRAASTSLQEAVRRAVRERSGAEVVAVFTTSALPTDIRHNSKIDRAALSRWAGQTLRGEWADAL
ncbi:acyl-coenzyme A synthetase/AMP-(fatty) acid ligase/pimeloyl-ACP methyl ester carboxylesterase [Brachybacterium sacelli]|uniref:Acyl-coenzyme A synthetase/AMP-(Fatty) acid ligase/pimeloyl-ACP methyl ester carboxylesterase n=2 Tax=Brachybacterium sacelli TaxID=173364 RepID=A0ABS4X6Q5_9MICO|nr:acyl-coenzyme A synthetase/AMP-(fatty) acid ligase/pimeloyl-ACP methyl ester carboxylesterase [Brachybacterium sacelli]